MNTRRQAGRAVLALGVAGVLVACDRGDRASVDTSLSQVGNAVGGAIDSVGARIGGREYTNPELLGFLMAHGETEVEMAEMARPKATNPQVQAFARTLADEHRALKSEITSAAQRLNVSPAAPAADDDLREEHREAMRELQEEARGAEFDRKFVEHEIEMQREVLDELDGAIGNERHSELRQLLERVRTTVRAHLTAAEELQGRLRQT